MTPEQIKQALELIQKKIDNEYDALEIGEPVPEKLKNANFLRADVEEAVKTLAEELNIDLHSELNQ